MTVPYDTPPPTHRPSTTIPPARPDSADACASADTDVAVTNRRDTRLRAEAAVWMIRLDAGRVRADDAALARWCGRSPAHRDALASARLHWERATPITADARISPRDSAAPTRPERVASPSRPGRRWRSAPVQSPVAAASNRRGAPAPQRRASLAMRLGIGTLFAGAALSIAAMYWFAPDFDSGTGTVRAWTLADGTVMRLDAQTAVDMQYSNNTRRIVLRRGRAAFTVAHGDPRPFIVDTGEASVTDIGTAFQVDKTDTAARSLSVIVTQGAVRFANAGVSRTMLAGDIGRAHRDTAPTVTHATLDGLSADTAWQRGRLQFDNRPLISVVTELNRYFPGHHIFVDAALRDERVSGNVALNDPASALATLVEVLHLRQTTWAGRLIFLAAQSSD